MQSKTLMPQSRTPRYLAIGAVAAIVVVTTLALTLCPLFSLH